jgi:uncharacterized protein (DUF433 family)
VQDYFRRDGGGENGGVLMGSWPLLPLSRALYRALGLAYLAGMDYSQIITMEPGKRSGKPCIRGTRMTVLDVLEYLAEGMSYEDVLADFPHLTEADIRACLAFAADRERERELAGPVAFKRSSPRVLGEGVGEMTVPSWEEWKAIDKELERELNERPLISGGL